MLAKTGSGKKISLCRKSGSVSVSGVGSYFSFYVDLGL
jgi:hypothetical protein